MNNENRVGVIRPRSARDTLDERRLPSYFKLPGMYTRVHNGLDKQFAAEVRMEKHQMWQLAPASTRVGI